MTEIIKGKYFIRLTSDMGYHLPGQAASRFEFWTNSITHHDDGCITFTPINTSGAKDFPVMIDVHMQNCVIYQMWDGEKA